MLCVVVLHAKELAVSISLETTSSVEVEKNKQLIVLMDIVDHFKPKYVLLENVVDLLKFADGLLGRYALGRLVGMNYKAKMGMMCAGPKAVLLTIKDTIIHQEESFCRSEDAFSDLPEVENHENRDEIAYENEP
ncbi:hypothetical protein ACLB2K_006667 [Fragaria x ananassa]